MLKFIAIFLIAICAISAWADSCFDDEKLAKLLRQPAQGTLVYVWSPRMVLSAQHAASVQHQARLKGLDFVALHDAQVPAAELQAARERLRTAGDVQQAQSALSLAHSQPLCAASLLERDALRHFPTAFVLQSGGMHRHPIVGAMPDAAWASSIAQRLDGRAGQGAVQRAAQGAAKGLVQDAVPRVEHSAAQGVVQDVVPGAVQKAAQGVVHGVVPSASQSAVQP